eukprot:Pompholyxophrys_sp_v1_NODE_248_length_980_cov_1.717838.p1 type:complete len:174 gc:universal NODE_248_length_980_cov_1.717838:110-631(+)
MLFPEKVEDHEYDCVIGEDFEKIKLSEIKAKYKVIIFYPLDFTFVCPTEIRKMSELADDFKKHDAFVVFASSDSKFSHLAWVQKPVELNGLGKVNWPILSDINHRLSKQFNLFNEKTGTVMRSTVILGSNLEVLHLSANIDSIGRSSKEILRLLGAFKHYEEHGEVCLVDSEY